MRSCELTPSERIRRDGSYDRYHAVTCRPDCSVSELGSCPLAQVQAATPVHDPADDREHAARHHLRHDFSALLVV
jgi:hypothetical protein